MIAFHGTSFYTSTVGGNARWAAPEIYRVTDDKVTRSVTVQSDVYSFGCIILEVRLSPPTAFIHRADRWSCRYSRVKFLIII